MGTRGRRSLASLQLIEPPALRNMIEPEPELRAPPPVPGHLGKPEQAIWQKIAEGFDFSSVAAFDILAAALEAHQRARECREMIKKDGLVLAGAAGQQKAHPLLAYIEPGERTTLDVEAEAGALLGTSPDGDASFLFRIDPASPPGKQHFEISCNEHACDTVSGSVAPGKVTFDITNIGAKRLAFSVWQLPPGVSKPPPLHFAPFLSGKRLLTTQTFRNLFHSEVTSQGIGIKDITLLFTDLKGSTALYDRIGDLNAFSLVQQHFDRLQEVTRRNDGAIIKTIGDAVMAAFRDPAHAVRAALEMRKEIGAVNRGASDQELILKIGLHKGAAIAVTLNDRLDYFGQTVNIAARVQNLADADEIYLSEDIYTSQGVGEQLVSFSVEAKTARLRGINKEIPVFKVATTPVSGSPPR